MRWASVLSETHLCNGVAKAVRCAAGQESFFKSKVVQWWDNEQKGGASCCSAGRDIAACLLFSWPPNPVSSLFHFVSVKGRQNRKMPVRTIKEGQMLKIYL